ncbi:MAG TPA: hypothetical protein VMW38_10600 [Terriglobia bacterium]|nr:hypothetical protein [Terriglobia bacterium]
MRGGTNTSRKASRQGAETGGEIAFQLQVERVALTFDNSETTFVNTPTGAMTL